MMGTDALRRRRAKGAFTRGPCADVASPPPQFSAHAPLRYRTCRPSLEGRTGFLVMRNKLNGQSPALPFDGARFTPTVDREELDEQQQCFACGAILDHSSPYGLAVTEGVVLCPDCCMHCDDRSIDDEVWLMPSWFADLAGSTHHT
jgi:hypothetical protein